MSLPKVSEKFDLSSSSGSTKSFVSALRAIDSVHRDGVFPTITATADEWEPEQSRARFFVKALSIQANLRGDTQRLSILHEVGHLLDLRGFGTGKSVVKSSPDLKHWRNAVRRSSSFIRLWWMANEPGFVFYDPNGLFRFEVVPEEAKHTKWLLSWDELWARSYAQFIAVESGDRELRKELSLEQGSSYGTFYLAQWSDDDFQDVYKEMRAVVRAKGWMR